MIEGYLSTCKLIANLPSQVVKQQGLAYGFRKIIIEPYLAVEYTLRQLKPFGTPHTDSTKNEACLPINLPRGSLLKVIT